jgi:hypothetical protein
MSARVSIGGYAGACRILNNESIQTTWRGMESCITQKNPIENTSGFVLLEVVGAVFSPHTGSDRSEKCAIDHAELLDGVRATLVITGLRAKALGMAGSIWRSPGPPPWLARGSGAASASAPISIHSERLRRGGHRADKPSFCPGDAEYRLDRTPAFTVPFGYRFAERSVSCNVLNSRLNRCIDLLDRRLMAR